MPEIMLLLLIAILVRAAFFPWGSRAVCHDVFSSLFGGGPKASSSNFNSTPTTTVSPGLSATQFGKNSGSGGGGGVGGGQLGAALPGSGVGTASFGSAAPSTVQPFSGSLADAFAQGATQTTQPDGTSLLVFPSGETFSMGSPSSAGPSAAAPGSGNFLGVPSSRGA